MSNFTRGGQMMTHQMRMFGQGVRASLLCGLVSAVVWGLWRLHHYLNTYDVYYGCVAAWASLKLSLMELAAGPLASRTTLITFYHVAAHEWYTVKALAYLNWETVHRAAARVSQGSEWIVSTHFAKELLKAFALGSGLSVFLFAHKGWKKHQRQFERGGRLVPAKRLAATLKKQRRQSDISFDGLPLVKDSETLHLLFSGTTGSGKTNALHKLLPQIRAKGQKALVVDLNGTFVATYYRDGRDILLNPFDARTTAWSPWADCHTNAHYDAFAEAIIPSGALHTDRFWEQAARTVLATALEELQGTSKTSDLCQLLLRSDLKTLETFFKHTSASYLVGEATDKMSLSVLATLANHIKGLAYMEDGERPFSLRRWVHDTSDAWVFLTAAPDQRATLKPVITTWLDIAFNGLLSVDAVMPHERRVWFILDELPALQKIPFLSTALAESRKYGGCVVAGIQNIHQLQKIYGPAEAHALLNLFNTSFMFRTDDPDTCRSLSAKLGEQEFHDVQENISYGANTMRDGVNLNRQQIRHTLVLPTEISLLPPLTCYVKYPGNWPIARLTMTLEKQMPLAPAFQVRTMKTSRPENQDMNRTPIF